jgi:choline dehydrogenase-like flavoprotein
VLDAICQTLVPRVETPEDPGGLFTADAAALETRDRVEQLIGGLRDPGNVARLRTLLRALGSPLVNVVLSGRWRSLVAMDPTERERVLAGWAFSRLPGRRAGFQALKRLVQVAFYCWPDEHGSHPAWRATGYSGPLPPPARGLEPLPTLAIERDTTLECDVVVVGSGAAGGVVAGVLSEAGRDVVVLERGPALGAQDMTQIEGDMLSRAYLDGGLLMTQSGSMPILAGSCVGGGTVINYTTSFPLPDGVRDEWDARSGLALFSSRRISDSFERVRARLDVGTRWTTPGARDRILERGCRAMGWHVDAMPRNVTNCLEGAECGFCGYGCRHGAKNSTATTYLADAVQRGARVVADCEVERILVERGRAVGVTGIARRGVRGHAVTVRARRVVVACGAIYTPVLLARSGLRNPHLGRHLHLHPATALIGMFDERVEPWTGALQTRYSDEFARLQDGYGVKLETAPVHFAMAASGFGWAGARQAKEDVARLGHVGLIGVLLRDRQSGRVDVSRGGYARVRYELSPFDAGNVRRGLGGAAQVLRAAGARELVSLHTPPARVRTDRPAAIEELTRAMDARGYRRGRMSYISFHQMGTAAMGADPARSVVDGRGASHDVAGLYVADGSLFPDSSGVNPMLTIMALADHVARGIAEEW